MADYVAFVLALLAVLLELVADEQMRAFSSKRTGRSCDVGLWAYSRHPNYLGEILFWVAQYIFALGADAKAYWWTFVGPVVIATSMILASIPLMEKRQLARRADYAEYQARTSMLLLWPPRANSATLA